MNDWLIYRGVGVPHDGIERLPAPPPWRDFDGTVPAAGAAQTPPDPGTGRRLGRVAREQLTDAPDAEQLDVVNAALYLRRPLLVTGRPGTGKSTLAHAVAHELKLGRVLRWPVVSRTTLQDGLYRYDALARLQDVQVAANAGRPEDVPGIGDYIRLGPLGTALLPGARPRVLLIDELDKSDIDLPNDLLNVLEEGEFAIPELERAADRQPEVEVLTDDGRKVTVRGGRVACRAFPFTVLTSNGERDFPAALLRRCIHLELAPPDEKRLSAMVKAHLGAEAAERGAELIREFLVRSQHEVIAADQLLNAIYLTHYATPPTRENLADLLVQRLDRAR
ncbi:AAA family ATPase [Streptomyces sp. cg28]|uniref:AAA family ATPase n=1 Tax=unclassified Streptomyces TaxID=2593676 RepID=UPI000DBA376D|nr:MULTISPECIES: MoxR family ATPase [unclassified Streptomyces]MYT75840.1 AAA domain-containing protein [Streptomyces sp. SID8367]RAJ77668.1 dynein-related subfamily AAA family protein [Streptomyces sp. PsTaAH-137]